MSAHESTLLPNDFNEAVSLICDHIRNKSIECPVWSIAKLIRYARHMVAPHTIRRSFSEEWDGLAAYVFMYCMFPSTPADTWKRLCKDMFNRDLNLTPPFDGSEGLIVHTMTSLRSVFDAVAANDSDMVQHIIRQYSSSYFPILHAVDEFGWNLLHHAAHHDAVDTILVLSAEGLSTNSTCLNGKTPLHIAASALRYEAILCLCNCGTVKSRSMRDNKNMTPLMLLLHSVRTRDWSNIISSRQLLKCVQLLCIDDSDLWNTSEERSSECVHPRLSGEYTLFTQCMLYLDSNCAISIINSSANYVRLLFRNECVRRDSDNLLSESLICCQLRDIILELKRCIVLVIQHKKAQVLKEIVDSFGDYISVGTRYAYLHSQQVTSICERRLWYSFDNYSTDKSLVESCCPVELFWLNCLQHAAISNSLRIISLVMTYCGIGTQHCNMNSLDHEHSAYPVVPILIIPALRNDLSMLSSILERFKGHKYLPVWISSSTMQKSSESSIDSYRDWCLSGKLRSITELARISYDVFSPIAVACLLDNVDILRIFLKEHWFSRLVDRSEVEEVSEKLYTGINPLVCCILSGSVKCAQYLHDYFGPIYFAALCNRPDDFELLPLHTLLRLLRVKHTKRLFRHTTIQQLSPEEDLMLYQTISECYSSVVLTQNAAVELVHLILPFTELKLVSLNGSDLDSTKQRLCRCEERRDEISKMRATLVDSGSVYADGIDSSNLPPNIWEECRSITSRWKAMELYLTSVSFVSSLKVLLSYVKHPATEINRRFVGVGNLRKNAHLSNMCRAVVLILRAGRDRSRNTISSENSVNKSNDWWYQLSILVGNDCSLPFSTGSEIYPGSSNEVNSRKTTRFCRSLLSMKSRLLPNDLLLEIKTLLSLNSRNGEFGTCSDDGVYQYFGDLLQKKSNSDLATNVSFSVVMLYKWIVLVINQNALSSFCKFDIFSDISLADELEAIDYITTHLKNSVSSTTISHMLGEDQFPVAIDMAVCASHAFIKESMFSGILSDIHFGNFGSTVAKDDDSLTGHSIKRIKSLIYTGRVSQAMHLASHIDYEAVCDTVVCMFIEDGRERWDVVDVMGVPPLLAVCARGLWNAAEQLLPVLSKLIVTYTSTGTGYRNTHTKMLFTGGLKSYEYLCRVHRSSKNLRRNGYALYRGLNWNLDDVRTGKVKWVDALTLAILRRANKFAIAHISQIPNVCRHDIVALAYLTDNPELCVTLAGHMQNFNLDSNFSDAVISGVHHKSNCWFSNLLFEFSPAFALDTFLYCRKKLSAYSLDRKQLSDAVRTSLCASVVINILYENMEENFKLVKLYNRGEKGGAVKQIQVDQQVAMQKHGFYPQKEGDLCGLCLSKEGFIWMMDGSLMSYDQFFSNISNISRALPAPHSWNAVVYPTGYTLLHSVATSSCSIPHDILQTLLSIIKYTERNTSARMVSNSGCILDIIGRSPAFISLSRKNVDLARVLLTGTLSERGRQEEIYIDALVRTEPVASEHNCSKLGTTFLRHAVRKVEEYEQRFASIIQGGGDCTCRASLLRVLKIYTDRIVSLWDYLRHDCDVRSFTRLVCDPCGLIVDCLQRAKKILLLLNIPFSNLRKESSDTKIQQDSSSKSNHITSVIHNLALSDCKAYTPEMINECISWKTATDIKYILQEWLITRLRYESDVEARDGGEVNSCNSHASCSDDVLCFEASLFLSKGINTSLASFASLSSLLPSSNLDKGKVLAYSIPFSLLVETKLHSKTGSQYVTSMSRLLRIYNDNPRVVHDALKCAMVILEFGRTMSMARVLVSMTQEPMSSFLSDFSLPSCQLPILTPETDRLQRNDVARAFHPLDKITSDINAAKTVVDEVNNFILKFGSCDSADVNIHAEYLSDGPTAHVKIEGASAEQLKTMLEIESEVSPTFSNLRGIILRAMLIILDAKDNPAYRSYGLIARTKHLLSRFLLSASCGESECTSGDVGTVVSECNESLTCLELEELSKSIECFLSDLRVLDFALVEFDQSFYDDKISILHRYVRQHEYVFRDNPQIELVFSDMGDSSASKFVDLRHCPSRYEINDLMKFVTYFERHASGKISGKRCTVDIADSLISRLRDGYSTCKILIDVVEIVMGLYSMAYVYVSDWASRYSCGTYLDPYIVLCHIPICSPLTVVVSEHTPVEQDLVTCFDSLVASGISLSSTETISLSFSSFLGSCSRLQYFIVLSAIFGRLYLLECALKLEDKPRSSCFCKEYLVWYVAMLSPPVSSSHKFSTNYFSKCRNRNALHEQYEKVLLVLVSNGYSISSPENACLSTMDILCLKQYVRVVGEIVDCCDQSAFHRPLSFFGALHFTMLGCQTYASYFPSLLASYDDCISKSDSEISFSDFVKGLVSDISMIISPLMHDIITVTKFFNSGSTFNAVDDEFQPNFCMDHILSSCHWKPEWLARSILASLLDFRRPDLTYTCPLHSFFERLWNTVSNLDVNRMSDAVTYADQSWTSLTLSLAAPSPEYFLVLWDRFFKVIDWRSNGSDIPSSFFISILNYASYYGLCGVVKKLLLYPCQFKNCVNTKAYFSVLKDDLNPVEVAITVGSSEIVEVLVDAYKLLDYSKNMPLLSMSHLLLSLGSGRGGESMAMCILRHIHDAYLPHSHVSFDRILNTPLTTLPRFGVKPGETLLHVCARRNFASLCEVLINYGANVLSYDDVRKEKCNRPIHVSIACGHGAVTRVLGNFSPLDRKAAEMIIWTMRRLVLINKCRRNEV